MLHLLSLEYIEYVYLGVIVSSSVVENFYMLHAWKVASLEVFPLEMSRILPEDTFSQEGDNETPQNLEGKTSANWEGNIQKGRKFGKTSSSTTSPHMTTIKIRAEDHDSWRGSWRARQYLGYSTPNKDPS